MSDRSVSVIIPCHNYARFLPDAINSVLGQTLRPAEILVVDDASTDRTIQVTRQHAEQGVRYLRVEHCSPYQTRRAGMEATESEAICFLDADDMLEEDYLESGLRCFDDPRVWASSIQTCTRSENGCSGLCIPMRRKMPTHSKSTSRREIAFTPRHWSGVSRWR